MFGEQNSHENHFAHSEGAPLTSQGLVTWLIVCVDSGRVLRLFSHGQSNHLEC